MRTTPAQHEAPAWSVFVDTGGTFTDCLAIDPAGRWRRGKVLSSGRLIATVCDVAAPDRVRLRASWAGDAGFAAGAMLRTADSAHEASARILGVEPDGWLTLALSGSLPPVGSSVEISTGEEAPILAARLVTRTPANRPLPPMALRLATTRGTNALLERRGGPAAFFVTEGFADLLVIGDQTRPDLFALHVVKPKPLHDAVVEVCERVGADGTVVTPLNADRLREQATEVLRSGTRVAAVALANAWIQPAHERAVRDVLLGLGFEHVSVSTTLGATIGFLARAETAMVNAFLAPVIDRYLDRVEAPLPARSTLRIMTSAGGLVDRPGFHPKDSLLSGPAGGVIGAAAAGRAAGFARVISFDMGGTSTDCARCEGPPERVYQTRVGDARILAPAVAVESVAAGGGSVCTVARGELRVGPESAGADPGPACYGLGGPLTITDCNLLLGRLDPGRFAIPIDPAGARLRAEGALEGARRELDRSLTLEPMLSGFIEIANQRMSEAVRRITLRRGHDPAQHALVAFGGAGPQHACAIAEALGIERIIVPRDAGLLSAYGLGVARVERVAHRQVLRPLDQAAGDMPALLAELTSEAAASIGSVAPGAPRSVEASVEVRYVGQDDIIELEAGDPGTLNERFTRRYLATFGYAPADHRPELVAVRVTLSVSEGGDPPPAVPMVAPAPARRAPVCLPGGEWREADVRERASLKPGESIDGPCLITEAHSTTFVDAGWRVAASVGGSILLERTLARAARPRRAEAVEVELAAGKLGAIAMEMGERLRRTALSTNIKQRLDFSCAILDRDGRLVVNAPHVPVHLGSMGVCVRAVRDALGGVVPGTVVTNHPAFGGSHLPDVTVVHPVRTGAGELLAYVACRAHHAEIGGISPGSMTPEATTLVQEGVVIPPTVIGDEGAVDWGLVRELFLRGPFPSRSPETNARDLAAAVHAAWAGAEGLRRLAATTGPGGLHAICEIIQDRADRRVRAALAARGDGVFRHLDRLDDGTPICVRIDIAGERAVVDFTGSGPVHPRCLNATPAIVTSAVVYVLRLLIDEPLPLNEGLLRPVELRIPEGLLSPKFVEEPARCPAVAGGNVEISQLVVESMLTALSICAQSQGTMNNVLFGARDFGFYETLGGGIGATARFSGECTTHSHMTNTYLSDLDILESRYPVRLLHCRVRRGSGGAGVQRGGDGMERAYEFLRALDACVLAERRVVAPRGLFGGKDGLPGEQLVLRNADDHDGAPFTQGRIEPGQVLAVRTPGGGAWGSLPGASSGGNRGPIPPK